MGLKERCCSISFDFLAPSTFWVQRGCNLPKGHAKSWLSWLRICLLITSPLYMAEAHVVLVWCTLLIRCDDSSYLLTHCLLPLFRAEKFCSKAAGGHTSAEVVSEHQVLKSKLWQHLPGALWGNLTRLLHLEGRLCLEGLCKCNNLCRSCLLYFPWGVAWVWSSGEKALKKKIRLGI